jgi:hypothetical protein
LRDLEHRAADLITVSNAHGIIRQSFDGEVLAELSVDEVRSLELLLPMTIRLDLVHEDGALLTAVPCEIALTISVEIQPSESAPAAHGILPDRGVHSAPFPFDVPRKSDVYG